MDIGKLIYDILIILLPLVLTFIFGRLGIDRIQFQRYQGLLKVAEDAVLWAEDAFPQAAGPERLKKAIALFKQAAGQAGFLVDDAEADAKVRAAYQHLQIAAGKAILGN
ncbi:MAG TPA: hypothetical protein VLH40_06255 [Atribacteraceae bacterium]|nr:hypothetical protein [Atribacteraceae bacterium]